VHTPIVLTQNFKHRFATPGVIQKVQAFYSDCLDRTLHVIKVAISPLNCRGHKDSGQSCTLRLGGRHLLHRCVPNRGSRVHRHFRCWYGRHGGIILLLAHLGGAPDHESYETNNHKTCERILDVFIRAEVLDMRRHIWTLWKAGEGRESGRWQWLGLGMNSNEEHHWFSAGCHEFKGLRGS
jgi:hypothetical protein